MTPGALAGYFFVPVFGALMCAAPISWPPAHPAPGP
jgi:hypothetical protein